MKNTVFGPVFGHSSQTNREFIEAKCAFASCFSKNPSAGQNFFGCGHWGGDVASVFFGQ
jgi:hypothetical protein